MEEYYPKQKVEQQTTIQEVPTLDHPANVPIFLAPEYQWFWTLVIVPIAIAWIVNRKHKKDKDAKNSK